MEHREVDQGVGSQEEIGDDGSDDVQFSWRRTILEKCLDTIKESIVWKRVHTYLEGEYIICQIWIVNGALST